MNKLLDQQNLKAHLLANPELMGFNQAALYLLKRMRIRMPLEATEYLQWNSAGDSAREAYQKRLGILLVEMGIYQEMFPREYTASQAPAFSTKREHELYRLINRQAFPIELSQIEEDSQFFWPLIPLQNLQSHDWNKGCCPFNKLELVFRLALVLSGRRDGGWRSLGIKQEPKPPLAAKEWTIFIYACSVEDSPLKYFPHAFDMTCYRTGNAWLDCPTDRVTGMEWTHNNIAMLFIARVQATQINYQMKQLNEWLEASPENFNRAVELWNQAATTEWD